VPVREESAGPAIARQRRGWWQYRRIGRLADHGYGEKVYLVLSLVAKSALAWQIFGGSLAG